MKYLGLIPFMGILIAEMISRADIKFSVKRKAFRWIIVLSLASFLVVMPLTGMEYSLMVFAVPILAWVGFAFIKYTKFCERCGASVKTNIPFIDETHCPRCNSSLD